MKTDVSFIVLNWHNEPETAECIESIKNLVGKFRQEIIVVDNESTAASYALLSKIKDIKIIRNKDNLGFAGGVNSGLRVVKGKYTALINNDCVLDKLWLKHAIKIMQDYKNEAIVGGKEYIWSDGQGPFVASKNFYAWPKISPLTGYSMQNNADMPESPVSNITGSNMLTTTKIIQDLGGFDEDFFAYYEDVDLCARALAKNYSIVYSPRMNIWHKRNVSSNKLPFLKFYLAYRNNYIFVAKSFPSRRWAVVVLESALKNIYAGSLGLEGGLTALLRGNITRMEYERRKAYILAGLWGLYHWRYLIYKRKQCISRRENDPNYLVKLKSLQA